MKLRITQDHIDDGKPDHVCECPIALALKETLKERGIRAIHLAVEDNYVRLWVPGEGFSRLHRAELPEEAKTFIQKFDYPFPDGSPGVDPLEFELTFDPYGHTSPLSTL